MAVRLIDYYAATGFLNNGLKRPKTGVVSILMGWKRVR
jgi:hypothetical protein